MNPSGGSDGRGLTTAELQARFEQFAQQASTDVRISDQLTAWLESHRRWHSLWTAQRATSQPSALELLIPSPASADAGRWVHPVAGEAPELDAWRATWQARSRDDRDGFSIAFARIFSLIQSNPDSFADGCRQLEHAAGSNGLPLAAFTPALAALEPARYVVMCDAWLPAVGQYDAAARRLKAASAFPELNSLAIRMLAAAERDGSRSALLASAPMAVRFGTFCSWLTRTSADGGSAPRFDVTQKKYKDWPPMW